MKRIFLWASSLLWAAHVLGQTADNYILQGRSSLAAKDPASAHSQFAAAVSAAPNHQTANAFLMASRLLSLPYRQPTQDILDRLGVARTNRDIYAWTAKLPTDQEGNVAPPNDFSAAEIVAFVRTNILSEVGAALVNASKVTDRNFVLTLSSNETAVGEMTVDYGDIQMIRACLHAAEMIGLTLNALNLDVQLNALYTLQSRGELTIERILADYPLLLMFSEPGDFVSGRTAFQAAVDRYLTASEFIRSRPANLQRLFNYDPEMELDELRFRTTLVELTNSLAGTVRLTYVSNRTDRVAVNLSSAFGTNRTVRSLLPQFHNNQLILGTLSPEADLGISSEIFESFLAQHIGAAAKFRTIVRQADGTIDLEIHSLPECSYVVEASSDLIAWTRLNEVTSTLNHLAFRDGEANQFGRRFYRVYDASNARQTGSGTLSNVHQVVDSSIRGSGENGTGGEDGGGSGQNPISLAGRAIDFTAAGQGNERLTFYTSGTTVTSDAINPPNNTGTYTFKPGTGGAPAVLAVTFPNGDTYTLTIVFSDSKHGVWSGNQFFDNADHPVPAGSSFAIQP